MLKSITVNVAEAVWNSSILESWFIWRYKYRSEEWVNMDAGIGPESELTLKSNCCSADSENMDAGIVPESELLLRSRTCNDGRVNMDASIVPDRLLLLNSILVSVAEGVGKSSTVESWFIWRYK